MKKKYFKITYSTQGCPQGGYIVDQIDLAAFNNELSELAIGDSYVIEAIEMTEEEFESLETFEGF